MTFEFMVLGHAVTSGSKRSFRNPRTGKHNVVPDSPEQVNWQNMVMDRAREAYDSPELMTGPLEVHMTFFRPRNKGHFGTGRNAGSLKDSAPAFPSTRPDLLKLGRAVEDALSGIVYRDDGQIVREVLAKEWGEPERVEVKIIELDATVGDVQNAAQMPMTATNGGNGIGSATMRVPSVLGNTSAG